MRTIRIDFCDFYPGFQKGHNFFYNLLKDHYEIVLTDKPDFLFYSHEGNHHRVHTCTKIYFTVESFVPDFSQCDYAFTCRLLDNPRHLRLPLYVLYGEPESILKERDDFDAILAQKTKFCSFVVSNQHRKTKRRIDFFQKLSRYKQVDSGGKVLNNIGRTIPNWSAGKVEFLKSYKFNIAFENSSIPGYTTEKIFEAMQARSLPIYWGNPLIQTEFNPESFLNYSDFPNEDALIQRIIELDRDEAKYRDVLKRPYFHNNMPNEFFGKERLLAQFERIFNDNSVPVAQRRPLFSFGGRTIVKKLKVPVRS